MKFKGFTLLELLLSLFVFSVSFYALNNFLEIRRKQQYNVKLYGSLYPFVEAFQWFIFVSGEVKEPIEGTWFAYKDEKGERKFLKQDKINVLSCKHLFEIKVQYEDPFYKVCFLDKSSKFLMKLYCHKI